MNIRMNDLARQILPTSIFNTLKTFRDHIMPLNVAYPVIQVYVNDGHTSSIIGYNNFYSCLLPDVVTNANMSLKFYNEDGEIILIHNEKIKHFESKNVKVEELFKKHKITSKIGLVGLQIVPEKIRNIKYKPLGVSSSHFFVFYNDTNGSIAQVHPSSIADPSNKSSGEFLSNQSIAIQGLKYIELIQTNPSLVNQTLTFHLLDFESREVVAEIKESIPAMGVRKIKFDIEQLNIKSLHVLLHIDLLPSSNSKPLLKRIYQTGTYSMSHS